MLTTLPVVAAVAAFIYAALNDIRVMLIPNKVCLALLVIAGLRFVLAPETIAPAAVEGWSEGWTLLFGALRDVGLAFVVFAVLVALWHVNPRVFGAGDIKLISAGLVWFGAQFALSFLFLTAILGGVLALAVIVLAVVDRYVPAMNLPRILPFLRAKKKVPYGVAISAAALITIWFQLEVWRGVA